MSENAVPFELGPKVLDFGNVTVINLTVPGVITSINGDSTPAQIITGINGVLVTDAGAIHTAQIDVRPGGDSGLDFGGINNGVYVATEAPLFNAAVPSRIGVDVSLGITKNRYGPQLELTGQNVFLCGVSLTLAPGVNNNVPVKYTIGVVNNVPVSHILVDALVGPATITGFDYAGVYTVGSVPGINVDLYFENYTSFPLTFNELDIGSSIGNRIVTHIGNITVPNFSITHFIWDSVKEQWKFVSCSLPLVSPLPVGGFVTNTGAPVICNTGVLSTLATVTIPSAGTWYIYAACNAPITNTTDCILDVMNGIILLGRGVGAGFSNAGIVAIGASIPCVPVVFAGGEVLTLDLTFASAGGPYTFVGSITAIRIG